MLAVEMMVAAHLSVLWLLGAILCANGYEQCANTEQDSHCDANVFSTYDGVNPPVINFTKLKTHNASITCQAHHVCYNHEVKLEWYLNINNLSQEAIKCSTKDPEQLYMEYGVSISSTCPEIDCRSTLSIRSDEALNNTAIWCAGHTLVCPETESSSTLVTIVTRQRKPDWPDVAPTIKVNEKNSSNISITSYYHSFNHQADLVWHLSDSDGEKEYSAENLEDAYSKYGITIKSTCPGHKCQSTLSMPKDKSNLQVWCVAYNKAHPEVNSTTDKIDMSLGILQWTIRQLVQSAQSTYNLVAVSGRGTIQVIQWLARRVMASFRWILFWIVYCFDAIKRLIIAICGWLTECMYHLVTALSQWITLIFSWAARFFVYVLNGAKQAVTTIYGLLTNAFLQIVFLLLLLVLAVLLLILLFRLIILLMRDTRKLKERLALFFSWTKKSLCTCWATLILTPLIFIRTQMKTACGCLKLISVPYIWSKTKEKLTSVAVYTRGTAVHLYFWTCHRVTTIWQTITRKKIDSHHHTVVVKESEYKDPSKGKIVKETWTATEYEPRQHKYYVETMENFGPRKHEELKSKRTKTEQLHTSCPVTKSKEVQVASVKEPQTRRRRTPRHV